VKVEVEGEIGSARFKIYAEDKDAKFLADVLLKVALEKQK